MTSTMSATTAASPAAPASAALFDRARRVMEEHCDDTAALLRGLLG